MRRQLFEFEDQTWFPDRIRAYMTDYLAFMATLGAAVYGNIAIRIADGAHRVGADKVVELGAGAAGPSVVLARAIRERHAELRYVLTDLYPNPRAWQMRKQDEPSLEWSEKPVDATSASAEGGEYRVLCNCFHHFDPAGAERVLRAAWTTRTPIAVIEVVERSVLGFVGVLMGLVLMSFATPFVRPFSLGRLVFTYLIPLVPLCTAWDGFVSCLRIYSPSELDQLVASMQAPDYVWESGKMKAAKGPGGVTYLIGEPRAAAEVEVKAS